MLKLKFQILQSAQQEDTPCWVLILETKYENPWPIFSMLLKYCVDNIHWLISRIFIITIQKYESKLMSSGASSTTVFLCKYTLGTNVTYVVKNFNIRWNDDASFPTKNKYIQYRNPNKGVAYRSLPEETISSRTRKHIVEVKVEEARRPESEKSLRNPFKSTVYKAFLKSAFGCKSIVHVTLLYCTRRNLSKHAKQNT